MTTAMIEEIFLIRTIQSVIHETLPDRERADELGQQIADMILENWDRVVAMYGAETEDEMEMVECFTRDLLTQSGYDLYW